MSWFDEGNDTPRNTTQPVGSPAAAPGGQQGGYQPYSQSALQSILEKYPPTYEGVAEAAREADRYFGPGVVKLLDHPTRHDKFQVPGGATFDLVSSAGAPNAAWNFNWTPEGPSHGGGGAAGGAAGAAGVMGGMDPSYAFRFAEGQKALEKSAASKGTLLTGGTLKALANYGQQMASTEFGNIFNRNYQMAGLGLNAAQSAGGLTSSQVNNNSGLVNNQAQTNTALTTGAANVRAGQQAASGNAWGGTISDLGGIAAGGGWSRPESRTGSVAAPVSQTIYGGGSMPTNGGQVTNPDMWLPRTPARSQR